MLDYPKGDTQEIPSRDFAKDNEDIVEFNDRVETVNPSDSKESDGELVNKVEIIRKPTNQTSENEFNLTHCPFQNCHIPICKRNRIEFKFSWKNLTIKIKPEKKSLFSKEKSEGKILVNDVSGTVLSGETLAVMGCSGSGKTTFLNVLSGKLETNSITTQGEIQINEKAISTINYENVTSYVTQHDQIEAYMTPLEILLFYAKMKLTQSTQEIELKVHKIISDLNLFKCRNSLIGDHIHRGISGGERKKLSIALSLIYDPKIIFLDEPTTGLDSANSSEVIRLLQKTAKTYNRIVIYTIHQPSSEIFPLIEKLFLMVNGKTVFYGNCNDVYEMFNYNRLPIPLNYNPFEYLMEITSTDALENKTVLHRFKGLKEMNHSQEKYDFYINKLASNFQKFEKTWHEDIDLRDNTIDDQLSSLESYQGKLIFSQTLLLIQRDLLISYRNINLLCFRILQFLGLGFIMSMLFYNLDYQKEGIQNRIGLIYFSYENPIRWSVAGVLLSCLKQVDSERKRYVKERMDNLYSIFSFLFSKLLLELPLNLIGVSLYTSIIYGVTNLNFLNSEKFFSFIGFLSLLTVYGTILGRFLGSLAKSSDIILHIYNIIYIPLVILSGFYSNYNNFPVYLLPFYYVSPFNYGFLTLFLNEFNDPVPYYCVDASDPSFQPKRLYYFPLDINESILIVLLLSLILFLATFVIIYKFSRPNF